MAQHDVTRNLGHFLRNFHSISKLFGINMSAVPTVSAEAFHATVGCPSLFDAARPERDFLEDFGLKQTFAKNLSESNLYWPFVFFLGLTLPGFWPVESEGFVRSHLLQHEPSSGGHCCSLGEHTKISHEKNKFHEILVGS